jgi:cytidylate kinase
MYRALAWAAAQDDVPADNTAEASALLARTDIQLIPQPEGGNRVDVNGRDVTAAIRTPEIGQLASRLSEIRGVREQMVARQQEMARGGGVVMEGRDIQTVVLPDAEVKIFLTASAETRARRRWLELKERGEAADVEQILAGIKQRDERDSNRAHSPLRAAAGAVRVDTSGLSIEEVVAAVLEVVQGRLADSG